MNDSNDIANEMADMMAEMAAEWKADDSERARKYKLASIFLAEKMHEDLIWANKKMYLKEATGSYVIRQKEVATAALNRQLANAKTLISFLKNADEEYFIGDSEKGTDNKEAVGTLSSLAAYFRGDVNNPVLAKISFDVQDFKMANMDGSKTTADAIIKSLEDSVRDIFKK